MQGFEKLGVFYLGRPYDLKNKKPKEGWVLYDSKDLVTHAICVGMTGSGKTGLCISLLEEAAIDGVPSIVIDPKGDLPNLLLTFPDLKGEDFAPWVNEEDAEKKGLSTAEYAAQQAEFWKQGLAAWDQDGARIKRFKESADLRIYTPGSNAGIQVSILKSFSSPPPSIREDHELMHERVNTTVTSLLGLLGIDADPLRSREHILLSNILNNVWMAGHDLDIAALIQQIRKPPMTKVGVMDLDLFFPSQDRFELAMILNNLLAAPAFGSWMEGEPLDIDQILRSPGGKPRISIFSIAHLNDAERMFFVSLLLNQILGWTRTQSGTASLRAIFYMDEIFGYFPPVANPPSKLPLLTLLKQGRAFGLGVVLATQNPVDLDYKGLSNTGTWFLGRLQTERDKVRVLEGLEGVAAGTGLKFDRQEMEQTLAGLASRIFVLNNVHEDGPEVFESRWAMSYLRGPLTRKQIKTLMDPVKAETKSTPSAQVASMTAGVAAASTSSISLSAAGNNRISVNRDPGARPPVLPPEITQYFIPLRSEGASGATLVYHPVVLADAEVRFNNKRIDITQGLTVLAPITNGVIPVEWDQATILAVPIEDLEQSTRENAQFADLPAPAGKAKSYDSWRKDFARWLYRSQKVELFTSPRLKVTSNPHESEPDFRVRLQQTAREQRDAAVDQLRRKYAPRIAALEEKRRRSEQAVERETEQAKDQKMQTAISFGSTLLSSFLGRKSLSLTTLGRATTTARGVGRSMKEAQDVGRAEETVAAVNQLLADLDAQFRAEAQAIETSFHPQTASLETIAVKPTKANIVVKLLSLAWAPYWHDSKGQATPAWQ
ncbi:MAG: ATP-binding protein [Acidobacteriota bacterium]|nr:ATP-binding protein [Acidobacteriota bacterium]